MKTKTICIVTCIHPLVKPWDPDTVSSGITGSEEAVIYLSEHLAELGYSVIVAGDPPKGSLHSLPDANPRFVDIRYLQLEQSIDVVVAWRYAELGLPLRKFAKKLYLWPHDILVTRLSQQQVEAYDDVLWLSAWQRSQWISVNRHFAKFTKIFGNGVNPEQFQPFGQPKNPYSCIYGSNYGRGLELLLDLWPEIKASEPRATLDIYYGWQTWGSLQPNQEEKMRKQVSCLPDVHDHGLVSHEELNRAYERSSFWTYPCNTAETFCISALRAQLAGAVPVIIEGSALSETVFSGYKCFRPEEYLQTLLKAFNDADAITLEDRQKMGESVLRKYTWKSVAARWQKLFEMV